MIDVYSNFVQGLRFTVILGAIGSAAAAWINVMSVASDRFYVVLIGQTVASIAQVFVLGVSPNVAAVWFGLFYRRLWGPGNISVLKILSLNSIQYINDKYFQFRLV